MWIIFIYEAKMFLDESSHTFSVRMYKRECTSTYGNTYAVRKLSCRILRQIRKGSSFCKYGEFRVQVLSRSSDQIIVYIRYTFDRVWLPLEDGKM